MFLPIKSYQQNCSVFLFQPTFLGIHIPMGSQGIPMLQIEFLNCCCDSSCLLLFVDVCWLCLLVMFVGDVSAFVASLAEWFLRVMVPTDII